MQLSMPQMSHICKPHASLGLARISQPADTPAPKAGGPVDACRVGRITLIYSRRPTLEARLLQVVDFTGLNLDFDKRMSRPTPRPTPLLDLSYFLAFLEAFFGAEATSVVVMSTLR